MRTYQDYMADQKAKLDEYLRPRKPLEYHELVRIWEEGGAECVGCTSGKYGDCLQCKQNGYQARR